MNSTGTIYHKIEEVMRRHYSFYLPYKDGLISREDYYREIMKYKDEIVDNLLTEDQLHLSSRFPLSEEDLIDEILNDLKQSGAIKSTSYPKDEFESYRALIYSDFNHGGYSTFIFPEEERIAFALSHIVKPSSAILLGSYYGYWGIWIMPAIKASGGVAFFVDQDKDVCQVASTNLESLGFSSCSDVIATEGTDYLDGLDGADNQFDFVVLDAEGSSNCKDPDFRGKAVYYPLVKACLSHIRQDSVLLCHNILLENILDDSYFKHKISRNMSEFAKFFDLLKSNFWFAASYSTTEGIGIYKSGDGEQ